MPVLTFQLALVLTACFTCGALATWLLQERRLRRERTAIETQMTRVLQARYEVYETLEKGFHGLLARFEAQANAGNSETRAPQAAETTLASAPLRSTHPELWDIERAYQNAAAEQLAQLTRQTERVCGLMEQVQHLEEDAATVATELAGLRTQHTEAVAGFTAKDQDQRATLGKLEARVRELEPLSAELDTVRASLESLRTTTTARTRELENELSTTRGDLASSIARCGEFEAKWTKGQERCRELETSCAEQAAARNASESRNGELATELETTRGKLTGAQTRVTELTTQCDAAERALGETRTQLQLAGDARTKVAAELKEALDRVIELEAAKGELTLAKSTLESHWTTSRNEVAKLATELTDTRQRADLEREELQGKLDRANAELANYREKLSHHSSHVVEAWSMVSHLKPMLEALEQKLKEGEEPQGALPGSSAKSFDLSALDEPGTKG